MSAAGTWKVQIPMVGKDFILVLKAAGQGKLTGTMVEAGGTQPDQINGSETGSEVHWEVTTPFDSQFDGNVNGNTMAGTVTTQMGTAPFNGTRV